MRDVDAGVDDRHGPPGGRGRERVDADRGAPPLGRDERVGEVGRPRASPRAGSGALKRRAPRARRTGTTRAAAVVGTDVEAELRRDERAPGAGERRRRRCSAPRGAARRASSSPRCRRLRRARAARTAATDADRDCGRDAHCRELYVQSGDSGCRTGLRLGCGSCLRRARSEPRRPGGDAGARDRAPRRAPGDRGRRRVVVPRDRSGRLPRPAAVSQRRRRDRHVAGARRRSSRRCSRSSGSSGACATGPRYGPRTVDLDLLLMDGLTVDEPGLDAPASARCTSGRSRSSRSPSSIRRSSCRGTGRCSRLLLALQSSP